MGTKAPVAAAARARKVSGVKAPALPAQNAEKIISTTFIHLELCRTNHEYVTGIFDKMNFTDVQVVPVCTEIEVGGEV